MLSTIINSGTTSVSNLGPPAPPKLHFLCPPGMEHHTVEAIAATQQQTMSQYISSDIQIKASLLKKDRYYFVIDGMPWEALEDYNIVRHKFGEVNNQLFKHHQVKIVLEQHGTRYIDNVCAPSIRFKMTAQVATNYQQLISLNSEFFYYNKYKVANNLWTINFMLKPTYEGKIVLEHQLLLIELMVLRWLKSLTI